MTNALAVAVLVWTLTLVVVQGYPRYQGEIPNGDRVPSPCSPNEIWPGVGHLNKGGSGKLNIFGEAFRAADFKWTQELCMADTDGDGWTNGEELGDPQCHFKPNNPGNLLPPKGHPAFKDSNCP